MLFLYQSISRQQVTLHAVLFIPFGRQQSSVVHELPSSKITVYAILFPTLARVHDFKADILRQMFYFNIFLPKNTSLAK